MFATIATSLLLSHSVLTHKALGIAYIGFGKNMVLILFSLNCLCSKCAAENSVKFGVILFYLYAKLISSMYKLVWRL